MASRHCKRSLRCSEPGRSHGVPLPPRLLTGHVMSPCVSLLHSSGCLLASHCSYHTVIASQACSETREWQRSGRGPRGGVAPAYPVGSSQFLKNHLCLACTPLLRSEFKLALHLRAEICLPSPWNYAVKPQTLPELCSCVLPPPPRPLNPPYTHTPSPSPES